jgi:hypothetical protein
VVIQVDIAPHADNRLLRVSASSGVYAWHAEQPLKGSEGPRRCVFDVRHLPAGEYYVLGEVIGPHGQSRARITQHVTVRTTVSSYDM